MVFLTKSLKKFKHQKIIQSLKALDPAELLRASEKKALGALKEAKKNPAYLEFFKSHPSLPPAVDDITTFKRSVPLMDKHVLFDSKEISSTAILKDAPLNGIQSILLSSGYTGTFSFGLQTSHGQKHSTQFLEVLLDYYFQTLDKRTLIINSLAQAVKLPSLSATVVEIGPRIDSLVYVLKKIVPQFEQTIIIGDNYFIKNGLEEGLKNGINYRQSKIHLILGGVYLPENLRTYLASLLKIDLNDPESGMILSSMGISEFGLNLFFESQETIALRRLAKDNASLKKTLLGESPYLPMFFNYFPQGFYLEEIREDIVITNLEDNRYLPLIRYNTKDKGKIIGYPHLQEILKKAQAPELTPPFKSPLVLISGKEEFIEINGQKIYPQIIQDYLYSQPDLAFKTTGYFRLSKDENGQGKIEMQIKQGETLPEETKIKFRQTLLDPLNIDIPIALFPYHAFPYSMELDYERKFKYL
jgi:phenylacetate-CoA ligase